MALTIMSTDLTGQGFTWSVLPNAVSEFNKAAAYLRKSNAAAALLDFLESDGKVDVAVLASTDMEPNFFPKEMCAKHGCSCSGSLVVWNPTQSLNVNDVQGHVPKGRKFRSGDGKIVRGIQSPAMALAHELGHARQYYLKQGWFMGLFNKAVTGNSGAKLEIENDNLLTTETVVARQLGEGIRWEYGDCGSSRGVKKGDYVGGGMDPVLA